MVKKIMMADLNETLRKERRKMKRDIKIRSESLQHTIHTFESRIKHRNGEFNTLNEEKEATGGKLN